MLTFKDYCNKYPPWHEIWLKIPQHHIIKMTGITPGKSTSSLKSKKKPVEDLPKLTRKQKRLKNKKEWKKKSKHAKQKILREYRKKRNARLFPPIKS